MMEASVRNCGNSNAAWLSARRIQPLRQRLRAEKSEVQSWELDLNSTFIGLVPIVLHMQRMPAHDP